MEPIGATASMLTLLAAAGQSCKFLHTLCIDLSEAPKDIQNQAAKLRCFDLTVQQIIKAYEKLPFEFEVDARLRGEIARFECEVTSMKVKIERKLEALRQGRKRQLRESCKWLLFDRQMTKFLQAAEHWSLIMNHTAMTAQIALSSRIDQNGVSLLSSINQLGPCSLKSAKETANTIPLHHTELSLMPTPHTLSNLRQNFGREMGSVPDRFTRYLYACAEPVGLTLQYWTAIGMGACTLDCNIGSLVARQWSPEGRETYQALRASEGYGLRLIAQSSSFLRGRVTLLLYATYTVANSLKFNLRCNLQWGRLLALDGPHHSAIVRGDIDYLMRQLSSRTLGIADVTSNGETLLHLAAGYGQSDLIDLLANAGADVNAPNNSGETPLHVCLRVGKSYECARRLLHHGADVLRENKDSRTPLHTFFNDAIGQFLRYHKDDLDAFSQDRRGMTVAHWASWTSQSIPEDITYQSIALKKSVSPYLVLDVHGKSVLHFAAERGNVSLVQHLLRLPEASRIAAPDNEGRTLLHYATASSRFHLVCPLVLTQQSDIYARDQHGQTVLHYAAMKGNASAVEHMFNLGLVSENDLEVKNIDGRTPLRFAQLNGRTSVVELLQLHFPRITATYLRHTMTYGSFEQKVFKNVEAISEGEVCEEETGRVGKQRANLQLLMTVVLLVLVVGWIYGTRKYSEYVSSNLILL